MNHPKSPAEIARETLKRLAAGHLPPTPENFQACYNEIANVPGKAPFPEPQLRHPAAALPAEFTKKLARFIESALIYLGDGKALAAETAEMLIQALRNAPGDFDLIEDLLGNLSHQTEVAADEQKHIRSSLLNLLHLIIENIGELALDESWLKGQIEGLLAVIQPPITLHQLDEMERRLRQVIAKQAEIKRQSVAAQKEMRTMLAAFVVSLATMNKSSAAYQSTIEESARKIENVKRIEELAPLLKEVIDATHAMAKETSHTRDELKGMQERVDSTEATLVRLYEELDNASAQARHDPLTDALNRKGLDDALAREIASVRRRNVPLSICLLDIDNFKKLNDRLGHEAGDQALIHLAKVARQCVRPNDILARYGGEEFVILMPDTKLDDGIEAMVRLQRELTKKFFMSDTEKILITFSAGVAELGADEAGIDAIKRADKAMYQAKRAGKNRVVGG
ncbi:MAG: diguanylate cyclase [Rhodocyclaceae bacterium]|nr:MAG: diguanylate cyclase [Rhodocyclaceae bacterium]